MPAEIVNPIEELLTEAGLPRLATRIVDEGKLQYLSVLGSNKTKFGHHF